MTRSFFCLALGAALFAFCFLADAQQPKIFRIGYLSSRGSSPPQEFLQALRKLGYEEGKNITIEHRSADSRRERVPDLAAELVGLKVDIIVAEGTNSTAAAKKNHEYNPNCDGGKHGSSRNRIGC